MMLFLPSHAYPIQPHVRPNCHYRLHHSLSHARALTFLTPSPARCAGDSVRAIALPCTLHFVRGQRLRLNSKAFGADPENECVSTIMCKGTRSVQTC
eukprot:3420355-Pleurochrysis_carterae.AAC.1